MIAHFRQFQIYKSRLIFTSIPVTAVLNYSKNMESIQINSKFKASYKNVLDKLCIVEINISTFKSRICAINPFYPLLPTERFDKGHCCQRSIQISPSRSILPKIHSVPALIFNRQF